MLRLLTIFLLLLSSILNTAYASSHGNIFIPYYFTPLSSFLKNTNNTQTSLTFKVHPDVLNYILNNQFPGAVAHQDDQGTLNFIAPSSVDVINGSVTLDTNLNGKFVFIAEPFTNDLDIVTHWQQSLNNGKGGFSLGARDALGLIDYYPPTNQFNVTWDIYNDADDSNPYTYNTDKYALFSADQNNPTAKVPAFERYVGENYAIQKITAYMALHMAVSVVESTGYPLLHKNHPFAFDAASETNQQVQQNIPAFQILHNTVIAYEADKGSLASFILPPNWQTNPSTPYPVLFNGFYDINFNTAIVNGLSFIQIIDELMQEGKEPSVGILWNGGGARGPVTLHTSAYVNAAYLFEYASILLGIDKNRMVFTGESRGGMTALNIAANPYFTNYSPTHVVAHVPATRLGEHADKWFSSNYPGLYSVSAWSTGYKYAYQSNWLEPGTGRTHAQVLTDNFFGVSDPNVADYLSPVSDLFVDALKQKNIHVNLLVGTHDGFMPFPHHLAYKRQLDAKGVSSEMHVGVRFGHNFKLQTSEILKQALRESMAGSTPVTSGIKFYQRQAETGAGYDLPVEVTAGSIPFFSELPKLAYPGQTVRLAVAGDKDATFLLAYYKIDDNDWQTSNTITLTSAATVTAYGSFTDVQAFQAQAIDYTFPDTLSAGFYVHATLRLAPNSTSWELIDPLKMAQPVIAGDINSPPVAVFEVRAQEFTEPALQLNNTYMKLGRGWGNSSH